MLCRCPNTWLVYVVHTRPAPEVLHYSTLNVVMQSDYPMKWCLISIRDCHICASHQGCHGLSQVVLCVLKVVYCFRISLVVLTCHIYGYSVKIRDIPRYLGLWDLALLPRASVWQSWTSFRIVQYTQAKIHYISNGSVVRALLWVLCTCILFFHLPLALRHILTWISLFTELVVPKQRL